MTQQIVLGIDEAGRGPGIGPMVLAAVAVEPESLDVLQEAGIRDSKAFGSNAAGREMRARLDQLIRERAAWVSVEVCDVPVIDAYVARGALNQLERERAALLIQRAPACERIIADGQKLFAPLGRHFPHLEAHDRAETVHLAVAAASICAKVLRDRLFEAIAERYRSDFGALRGGGYVNAATCAFIAAYVGKHGCLPPEARQSWPWQGVPGFTPMTSCLPLPRVR